MGRLQTGDAEIGTVGDHGCAATKVAGVGQGTTGGTSFARASVRQLAEGATVGRVAEALAVSIKTVKKWSARCKAKGLEGLPDEPRSGRPPVFRVAQRYEVIALACDSPANHGHAEVPLWTCDRLTEGAAPEVEGPTMSRSSIYQTLTQHALHPHHVRGWLHRKDPAFQEKVNEAVGLYLEPPPDAVVPGKRGKYEYEFKRHGTVAVLSALNVVTGEVISSCGPTRTADDLVAFMNTVADPYKDAKQSMSSGTTSISTMTVRTSVERSSMPHRTASSCFTTRRSMRPGSIRSRFVSVQGYDSVTVGRGGWRWRGWARASADRRASGGSGMKGGRAPQRGLASRIGRGRATLGARHTRAGTRSQTTRREFGST